MRAFFTGLLVFFTAGASFAASSDYERTGSMAWHNARSNERATDYASRVTANSTTNVTFSQEQIASIARGFQSSPPARENSYPSPRFNSQSPPPPPTEEEQHLASAKAGNAEAMVWLGNYYYAYANDKSVGLGWYEAAGRAGNGQGMLYAYALLMEDRFGLKNVPRALEWLRKLADLDEDPQWASRYAAYMRLGEGVPKDPKLAFRYELKAASHAKGMGTDRFLVAQAYAAGDGVEKDPLKAIEWYRSLTGPKFIYPAVVAPLTRLLLEFDGGAAKNQAEIEKLFTPSALSEPVNSFYYASLKDSGALPPRDPKVAFEQYSAALEGMSFFMNSGAELKPLRVAAAQRMMEMALSGDGRPVDRAAARAAGLAGLKVGEATFRPLVLGYLLIDPALGAPETGWAIKCFDAHPDDWAAVREAAFLARDTVRMAKLVDRGDGEAARFLADYERFFVASIDREGKPHGQRELSRGWAAKGVALANLDCLARQGSWLMEDAAVTEPSEAAAAMRAEGLAALKKATERQHPMAMARLGESYRDGVGVEKNPAEALRWFKKSAELGDSHGKYDLALAFYSGTSAPTDKPAALKLAGEAADEVPAAAGFLGLCLWRGDCGQQDVGKGVTWMEGALKKGYWPAGLDLAKIYHLGSGVPKDEKRARDYLVKAGEEEDTSAHRAVAEAFEKGEIIEQDQDESDTRFESAGGYAIIAAHYLREGRMKKAAWFVEKGEKTDPEIMRISAELEKDLKAKTAAELPLALDTLDKKLALLEAAATGFQPTADRKSFFYYGISVEPNRRIRNDDYERMAALPESPDRELLLGARDATLASEGDFEAAVIALQGYYRGDRVRGPRFLAAIKKIASADAERGDLDAMDSLVRIYLPTFQEEMVPSWDEDDREAVRWYRRALLLGHRSYVERIDQFYADPNSVPKATPKQVQQWKIFSAELAKISNDDPNSAAQLAACARKYLPQK